MTIYLPLALEAYNKTFSYINQKLQAKAKHNIYKWGDQTIVSPQESPTEAATPTNLINLKSALGGKELLIVDRTHSSEPIIQIIDHRNLSGFNPLVGKTPLDDRPRFPDVSKLYNKTDRGFPMRVVNCVGLARFWKKKEENTSETVAPVSLCAAYAGWRICALGWNKERDPTGKELCKAIKSVFLN